MEPFKVYEERPDDFFPKIETSACYLEVEGRLLLLQNASHKSEAGKWGVPAGKLEEGESSEAGAIRELWEETGIAAPVQFLGTLYIRKPDLDYIYHMFAVLLDLVPSVFLSSEHSNYRWVSKESLENLPYMQGAEDALRRYDELKKRRH